MIPERLRALPCWQGDIRAERLSGGLSNEIWKVTDGAGAHVVRFGEDYPFHHVSRSRELMAARAAAEAGFGPAVTYAEPGVMVTAFLEARTWTEADVTAAPERLAALLSEFHRRMSAHVSGEGYCFWVFHVIRDYARNLASAPVAPQLPAYLEIAEEMEAAQVPLPIVFGHHDLLPANILDDGQRLWLIDFEYAGFGTAMFDLAGAASNSGMTEDQSGRFLSAYFGAAPDAALRRAFDAMQCASLLREMLWAHVSGLHLATEGVDFAAYAAENKTRFETALARYRTLYGKPRT
ncbi:phosphotransferase [Frigidibacter sp. ROC022]|uniref:phosphotransferase n=1 Tax=Frigidibacter sp. ROC022 TaxID=2971796 RepID=UPI00215A10C3|nr:phosphotransferase [Frigidibacter sp. ROC022]MCR8726168.1 phosphotransferase [Frigidibacter sp. ROC022]